MVCVLIDLQPEVHSGGSLIRLDVGRGILLLLSTHKTESARFPVKCVKNMKI